MLKDSIVGFELPPSYFANYPVGKKFWGRLIGFSIAKNYYIGTCEVKSTFKKLENGELIYGRIQFVIQKQDIPLRKMLERKKQLMQYHLVLAFQGFTQDGYPKFTHAFV